MPQGADFNEVVVILDSNRDDPRNLSFVSAADGSMARDYLTSTKYEFTQVSVVGQSAGTLRIQMSGASTAALKPARYVYDVITYNQSNEVERILQGIIDVTPAVQLGR